MDLLKCKVPAFFSAEFESLVWVQCPPFNLQVKNNLDSHKPTFLVLFNNANKKARDPSALILPMYAFIIKGGAGASNDRIGDIGYSESDEFGSNSS